MTDGTNPGGDISRQEVAAMLYRYAQLKGCDTSAHGDLSAFIDGDQTADWAEDAMAWAVASGIIQGDNNRAMKPRGAATHGKIAQMFMNFMESI